MGDSKGKERQMWGWPDHAPPSFCSPLFIKVDSPTSFQRSPFTTFSPRQRSHFRFAISRHFVFHLPILLTTNTFRTTRFSPQNSQKAFGTTFHSRRIESITPAQFWTSEKTFDLSCEQDLPFHVRRLDDEKVVES